MVSSPMVSSGRVIRFTPKSAICLKTSKPGRTICNWASISRPVLLRVASMTSKPPRGMPKSMYLPSRTSMWNQSTPALSSSAICAPRTA